MFATISLNDGFELDLRDIDRILTPGTAGVFLQYNDLDQFVYPERGWEVLASGATYMNAVTELRYSEDYLGTLDPELAGILRELASDITEYDDYPCHGGMAGAGPLHRRVSSCSTVPPPWPTGPTCQGRTSSTSVVCAVRTGPAFHSGG